MKAVILSAGQGSRLLPHTKDTPKCLLPIDGPRTLLEMQIDALHAVGVTSVRVVTGFQSAKVEALITARYAAADVATRYNPFYSVTDNLATCWLVREEFDGDVLLINGDTLFCPDIPRTLLAAAAAPLIVTIDHKDAYDDDDMKVETDGARLLAIAKRLPPKSVTGEAIGMIRMTADGARAFRDRIETQMSTRDGLGQYYLSAVSHLAGEGRVNVCAIDGLPWQEVDFEDNLATARARAADLSVAAS